MDDGNSTILSYQVYRGLDTDNLTQITQLTSEEISVNDIDIINETDYVYTVTASNGSYEGQPSDAITVLATWNDNDFNEDGIINPHDLKLLANEWLWRASWH